MMTVKDGSLAKANTEKLHKSKTDICQVEENWKSTIQTNFKFFVVMEKSWSSVLKFVSFKYHEK